METETYNAKPSKALTCFKWILLWWPLIVLIPGIVGTQCYKLVLRDDTISPIVGTPRVLFYFSLFVSLCYAIVALTYCLPQVKAVFRYRNSKASSLLGISFIFTFFSVWAVGGILNGALDTSSPQEHEGKVLGTYRVRETQYVKVQDWRDPSGFVLFDESNSFLQTYPVGSTVHVVTKRGRFGYEYLIGIRRPKRGDQ